MKVVIDVNQKNQGFGPRGFPSWLKEADISFDVINFISVSV
jgi:hypothetical protein